MADSITRVLLVDDDEDELALVRGFLRDAEGMTITLDWVDSYDAALDSIMGHHHDAYLIDHRLGGSSGLDLMKAAQARGCRAPLILLTGQSDHELDMRAMQAGAADYLDKKHLSGPLLERSVRYAIEHARMVEQLGESNQALQALLDASPLAICVLDRDAHVSLWNPAAESIFGWSANEVLGRCLPIVPEDDRTRFQALLDRVMSGERLVEVPLRRNRKNGEQVDVGLWTAPLLDTEGHVASTIGIFADMTARRRAEEALRASEEFHRALLRNSLDITCVLNPSATIQYVSPSVARVLNFLPEDLLGSNAMELVHPDDLESAREFLGAALRAPSVPLSITVRLRSKDGSYRMFETTGQFLDQAAGLSGVVMNAHDITERNHTERLQSVLSWLSQSPTSEESLADWLGKAHRQISRLVDADNFYVALYDPRREVYWFPYVSDEHESFSVYTREEFRGTLTEYVRRTGKPLRINQSQFEAMVAKGEVDDIGVPSAVWMGVPLATPNGVIGVAAMQNYETEFVYGEGELEMFAAVGERIALVIERQQAEENRIRLATAIEQSADLVAITDADGNLEYVNPAFEKATGFEARRVLGKNPRFLKSGRHPAAFYEEMWKTISSGAVWSGHFVNRRRDGELFNEVATITPVRDTSGRIINYVKVSRDVTAQRMLEARLQQSQKLEAIGSLAAGVAHEINTPIQFIGNNMHFLSHSFSTLLELITESLRAIERTVEAGNADPEFIHLLRKRDSVDAPYLLKEIPEAISQSLDGIARVTDIVRAMREFSHPGTATRSRVDINRALEGALTVARSELKHVAEIVTDFEPGLPLIECYPNDINQVFLNLLVNAAQSITHSNDSDDRRGIITIKTRHSDGWIEVSVTDNGSGIPATIRDRVFEPFFTTKSIGQGTGQGLAIAQNAIEKRHGGTLRFESIEGVGTTFFVRLPVEPSTKEVLI